MHPTDANVPPRATLADYISMDEKSASEEKTALAHFARRLNAAHQIQTVGTVEGTREEMIGKVEDIEAGPKGRFYVLDSRYNEVRLYGPSARLIEAFGGPGRTPGRFLQPEKVVQVGQEVIAVADRQNRISFFQPTDTRAASAFRLADSLALGNTPKGLCALGDTLYIEAAGQRGTVHAFSRAEGPGPAFGQLYQSDTPLVQNQLSDGPVACSEDAQTVATMYDYFPFLYAYSPQGQPKWQSQLSNFRPMRISETVSSRGRPSIRYQTEGASDVVKTLTAVPGGYFIAQIARRTEQTIQAHEEYADLYTYVIDAATGQGIYVGDDLPPIYDATADRMYAGVNEPFPQVKVYQLSK